MTDPPSASPAPRRVLVVDDNIDAAESLGLMLQMLGHEVRTAHDGLAAVAVAARFQPQVALLDLGMPGVDGLEAARRIRALPGGAAMRLIALTGWDDAGNRARAREAGFDLHLAKPLSPEALDQVLA